MAVTGLLFVGLAIMTPPSQSSPSNQSFDGCWEERDGDSVVLPAAFNKSINQRDEFLGQSIASSVGWLQTWISSIATLSGKRQCGERRKL